MGAFWRLQPHRTTNSDDGDNGDGDDRSQVACGLRIELQ